MKRNWVLTILTAGLLMGSAVPTTAAFQADVEKAYNLAVQGQDALNGLDVHVEEQTVSSQTNIRSEKQVDLLVSGIRSSQLYADIAIATEESETREYYRNGYFYETTDQGKFRREMERPEIWEKINSQIYLDMTSNLLTMLYAVPEKDGGMVYSFASDSKTLGDYATRLLDAYSTESGAQINALQGTMHVDADGHVTERSIQVIYTIETNGEQEVFCKSADAYFATSDDVVVSLPDLSEYQDADNAAPIVTLTPLSRTVYVTHDVNVRAAGSLDAAVIGGYQAGSGVTQTAYTSDGWVQIQYSNGLGYIWGEYISTEQPVITRDNTGIMYATADVNVRSGWTATSEIIGMLQAGKSIEITGTTSNGWTRVKYNGKKGYISSNYLTWSEPVKSESEQQAMIEGYVQDASYGSLTVKSLYTGETVLFNTTYATINLKDTLETGDLVSVTFYGGASPYTAVSVTDNNTHTQVAQETEYRTTDGVVTTWTAKTLELSCSDGVYRTFDLGNAEIDRDVEIAQGAHVYVTWASTNPSATRSLKAVVVA